MKVEHSLELRAICPVDGLPDVYHCVIRCNRVLAVEEILAAVDRLKGEKLYQEELTRKLHRALAAEVETVGWHSGVMTRVIEGESA